MGLSSQATSWVAPSSPDSDADFVGEPLLLRGRGKVSSADTTMLAARRDASVWLKPKHIQVSGQVCRLSGSSRKGISQAELKMV